MDLAVIEKFFNLYLKEKKIKHSIKDKVYTIKFSKEQEEVYGKQIICTFDKSIAEKKNIVLIENGNFLLDNMIEDYTGEPFNSSLEFDGKADYLEELEEKRDEINRGGETYSTDELKGEFEYYLFEIIMASAAGRRKIIQGILKSDFIAVNANGIELSDFKKHKSKNKLTGAEKVMDDLQNVVSRKIELFEKAHFEKLNELCNIVVEHSEARYKEFSDKEDKIRADIKKCRDNMIKASTFKKKQDLSDKQKQLQKKLDKLIETHKKKREQLKKEHNFELEAIRKRDYSLHAKLIGSAIIKMPYYKTMYGDDAYYYFPALNEIFDSAGCKLKQEEVIEEEPVTLQKTTAKSQPKDDFAAALKEEKSDFKINKDKPKVEKKLDMGSFL